MGTKPKENILHAITLAMGHTSPATTLRSYIHLLGIMAAASNEQWLIQNIDKSAVIALVEMERTHGYKILSRGDSNRFCFLPLAQQNTKHWHNYQRLITYSVIPNAPLPKIKIHDGKYIFCQLNDIERIIRMAEKGNLSEEITQTLQLDHLFVKQALKAVQKIKFKTGYLGVNIPSDLEYIIFAVNKQKQLTSSKYIKRSEFQHLLLNLSQLPENKIKVFVNQWLQAYTPSHGLVITQKNLEQFKKLLSSIDYQVIDSTDQLTVREQHNKRSGVLLKIASTKRQITKNNDNRIQHALFLLTVWLLLKKLLTKYHKNDE